MINLINENGGFNDLLKVFPNAKATISIFGNQSSGKSTLCNYAFGTKFPVLNQKEGRKRCTKGVWYHHINNINIIDTQGFDSTERNQQDRIIYNKIALFCLGVSDVIIINLWMYEVNTYKGSQNQTLKTILKVSQKLNKSSRKLIIYTIRQCPDRVNEQSAKRVLTNNFKAIERECISQDSKKSIFQLNFLFLSSFQNREAQFKKQALNLQEIVSSRESSLNAFSPQDRLTFLKNIWVKINDNQNEVDLRSEQESLRRFIAKRVHKQICIEIADKLQEYSAKDIKSYRIFISTIINLGLSQFKKRKPLYLSTQAIQEENRSLKDQIEFIAHQAFTKLLPDIQDNILDQTLIKNLQAFKKAASLAKKIQTYKKQTQKYYSSVIKDHKQQNALINLFQMKMDHKCLKFQVQIQRLLVKFENLLENDLNTEIDKQLSKLKYNRKGIKKVIHKRCEEFQYNEWELRLQNIWEKVIHRALQFKIPTIIQEKSKQQFTIFDGPRIQHIVHHHRALQKKIQHFCQGLLRQFNQEAPIEHQFYKIEQKIKEAQQKAIKIQKKRFHISLLLIVLLMILLYGQFNFILKFLPFKKVQRSRLSYLYIGVIILLTLYTFLKPNILAKLFTKKEQKPRKKNIAK